MNFVCLGRMGGDFTLPTRSNPSASGTTPKLGKCLVGKWAVWLSILFIPIPFHMTVDILLVPLFLCEGPLLRPSLTIHVQNTFLGLGLHSFSAFLKKKHTHTFYSLSGSVSSILADGIMKGMERKL